MCLLHELTCPFLFRGWRPSDPPCKVKTEIFGEMKKLLVDVHCHLVDHFLDALKTPSACKTTQTHADVEKMLLMSTKPGDWSNMGDICAGFPETVVPSFGIHPWRASTVDEDAFERTFALMSKYLSEHKNAIVGEIGLDSSKRLLTGDALDKDDHEKVQSTKSWQIAVFSEQLKMAHRLCRPVSMHLVQADDQFIKIAKELQAQLPPCIHIHSYTGSATSLRALLKILAGKTRVYISISKKLSGRLPPEKLDRLIKTIPDESVLVESDAEFMYADYANDLVWAYSQVAAAKEWSTERALSTVRTNLDSFLRPTLQQ